MEYVRCALCNSEHHNLLWQGQDWMYGNSGNFCMVKCSQCELIFLNPRPEPHEMAQYYPPNYEPYQRTVRGMRSQCSDRLQSLKLRSRIRLIQRIAQGGRLLDIGCATGGLLREFQHLSEWDVYGVEIDQKAATYAREQLHLSVFTGSLFDASFPDQYFDVITMWDVLEHLHNPQETLNEIYRILKPYGRLLISTPNANSWDASFFKRYWIGLDFPRHLYVFSPQTLETFLSRAGMLSSSHFCFYGRYTTFALSASIWFNAHIPSPQLQRFWRFLVLFPAFRFITYPYFRLVDAIKRGAIFTTIAYKAIS